MELESKFFQSFFYPFFIGVILSMISIILFSIIFTNNYIDKKTSLNLIELERNNAKVNLNTIKISLSTFLLKIQASINEIITSYQKTSKAILLNPNLSKNLDDKYLKCALDLNDTEIAQDINKLKYMAYWFLDKGMNKEKLKDNSIEKKQLIAFNQIIPNLFSVFASTNSSIFGFYFYFESSELYLSFPLYADYIWNFTKILDNYPDNPIWCTNQEGKVYDIYKCRCREFYINIQKAKTDIFDYNSVNNKNRTIFVTEFYYQSGMNFTNVFTICVQFDEPISGGKAYVCADIGKDSLIFNFDNINNKLNGYFLVAPVGFNKVFYFPQSKEYAYTPMENIFANNKNFFLEEKVYFLNHVQKLMTSNYIKYIKDDRETFLEEVYTNGQNSNEQYFNLDGEAFNFSIYPIVFENIAGKKEHVLNIIYIYNEQILTKGIKLISNIFVQIILELIIFVVFGSGLLYLVVLSFNILAKYIVIPIKNVNYMLKGINIGGENRLDYLECLKKRQEDNIEMLEKMYEKEDKNIKKKNENENNNDNNGDNVDEDENLDNSPLINKEENDENDSQEEITNEDREDLINLKIDYDKKYDEESEFIEKESSFYNFDENLLQYRPLEIDHLIKSLIELKGASTLTSSDQTIKNIIDYSYSEDIFRNFKNKEGEIICQSNIGNLQSQLFEFDKAIYHLVNSLQDNKLKKFLSRNLYDELDESDNLLNKISLSFNHNRNHDRINLLAERQQNNFRDNFSQKIIGVLINTRYPRLIYCYYKFFSLLQKTKNSNNIKGQFMNTTFHSINYYHKIIIQYIFLSFAKNDLIKIGESILDYIEFLIKFKLKTNVDNEYLLDIKNINRPELKNKRQYKKYIFYKIVNWFILFDDYVSYVKNQTQLLNDKSIIEEISQNLNSEDNEFNAGTQSVFLLRVNIQREEYLKGKFANKCNHYSDALFYFIRAAQKNSIVLDGLIKKKALIKIFKIGNKLGKKFKNYGISQWLMKENFLEFEKSKIRTKNKRSSYFDYKEKDIIIQIKNNSTFDKEISETKSKITEDINECCAKNAKDIIIIIDFNIYNPEQISLTDKIESYINQTTIILEDYLSSNDRLSVFIYTSQYKIICPLLYKNKIDLDNFTDDLINFKKEILKEKEEESENDIEEEFNINEINNKKIKKTEIEFQKGSNNNFSDSQSQESFSGEKNVIKISDKVKGLVDTINYSKKYLKIKEGIKNERYLIIFTDLFNYYKITDEVILNNINNLEEDNIIFLLVGKNNLENDIKGKNTLLDEDDEKELKKILLNKFDKRSEIIYYENMKKIKNILSNNVIKDNIIFPNEIYK